MLSRVHHQALAGAVSICWSKTWRARYRPSVRPAQEDIGAAEIDAVETDGLVAADSVEGGVLGPLGEVAIEDGRVGKERNMHDRLDGVTFAPDIGLGIGRALRAWMG